MSATTWRSWTGSWWIGVLGGSVAIAAIGALMQVLVFQRLAGDELRQTLVTIGISVVAADLMLAVWGGKTYQFDIPASLDGAVVLPIVTVDQVERTCGFPALSRSIASSSSPPPSSSASASGWGSTAPASA